MKKIIKTTVMAFAGIAIAIGIPFVSCKKKEETPPATTTTTTTTTGGSTTGGNPTDTKYVLVISNGAQAVPMGKEMPLKAHLVSETGEVTNATNVTWSSDVGSISGANFLAGSSVTVGVISASAQHNGKTYTAQVPVSIEGASNLFGVVPSAIIWSPIGGDIPLMVVYLGSQSTSYSFSSTNADIASVSSAGVVSFHKAGNTTIVVKATIGGQNSEIYVPVLVVAEPEIPLPVTRVEVKPAVGELFRGEELQMEAKAYNSKGEDVTNKVTFSYVVEEKLEEDGFSFGIPVSINNTGKVKALTIGNAYVKVTAEGIMGQAEIIVNPDTVIMVTPFHVQLGGMVFDPMNPMNPPTAGPSEQTFTAKMQKVDRDKYRAKNPNFLIDLPNPSNLEWVLPEDFIPMYPDMFKVVTLSNKTTTSVKATKIDGKSGATTVIARSGIYGGVGSVFVSP